MISYIMSNFVSGFFPLNIISLRFVHIIVYTNNLFFFTDEDNLYGLFMH